MSGRITIENYEAFLLDLMEGTISPQDQLELEKFALKHPELNIDLNPMELPHLPGETDSVDFKNDLIKTEANLLEEKLIAYVEGILSAEEKQVLEKELAINPALKQQLTAYLNTRLIANTNETFDQKQALKKTEDDLVLGNPALAYLEQQLSLKDKNEFERKLSSDKQLAAEVAAFNKTVLSPDANVVHPDKQSLKKKNRVFFLFGNQSITRAAAAILLLATLSVIIRYVGAQYGFNESLANHPKIKTTVTDTIPSALPKSIEPGTTELAGKSETESTNNIVLTHKNKNNKSSHTAPSSEKDNKQLANNAADTAKSPDVIPSETINAVVTVSASNTLSTAIAQSTSALAGYTNENNAINSNNTSNYQVAVATDEDEEEQPVKKQGFWKRAVNVAHKANSLGLKSVDGEESKNKTILLSFNAFSIEKK
ncbi:MAG: hypothetical protein IT236_14455 [Bacteroidia bacterium]|nr:hypothetical protein [Bacteroidia bacterium]